MSLSRAVVETEDGTLTTLWEGTRRECLAYQAGAHLHSDVDFVRVVGPRCECGALRREHIERRTGGFKPRTGCLRCDNWDGKPELDDGG